MSMSQLKFVAPLVLGVVAGLCLGQSYRSGVAEQAFAQSGRTKPPEAGEKKTGEVKASELVALAKARVALARKGYQGATNGMRLGRKTPNTFRTLAMPEDAHLWSVRWLNAERDMGREKGNQVAALENHLARMKELQQHVSQSWRGIWSELSGPLAAGYFVAEAESWLAQEKAKGR